MTFAFYGPFAFVIGGTQHVIANVGFLGLPLLLNLFHPAAPRGGISWGFGEDGLITNIGITTAGRALYEREWARYRELYPDVHAPEPQRAGVVPHG